MDYRSLSIEELLETCLQKRDEEAWAEFVRRLQKLIGTVVLRTARRWGEESTQALDDLIQETYLKLCADDCRLLRSFTATRQDAIYGYVKVLTANLVHDHFRASNARKRGRGLGLHSTADMQSPDCDRSPSSGNAETIERSLLISEIGSCLNSLDLGPNGARDRRVFWLHYRTGLPASAIAALPAMKLTTKGVESILFRLTRQIREIMVMGKIRDPKASGPVEGIRTSESF